jgi:hypothetical protein
MKNIRFAIAAALAGPAEEVSPGSTGVSAHGGELVLKLTRGTFGLNIVDSDGVPLVPGSGTGAYRG